MYHENVFLVKLRTGAIIHQYRYIAINRTTHLSSVLNHVRELLLDVQQECTNTHVVSPTPFNVYNLSHTPFLVSTLTLSGLASGSILDPRVDHVIGGMRHSND
jgi:hypothetical protein